MRVVSKRINQMLPPYISDLLLRWGRRLYWRFDWRRENYDDSMSVPSEILLRKLLVDIRKDIEVVIEIGCGEGSMLRCLAREYPDLGFVGFDIQNRAIKEAVSKSAEHTNIEFVCCDASGQEFAQIVSTLNTQVRKYVVVMVATAIYFSPDELFRLVRFLSESGCSSVFFSEMRSLKKAKKKHIFIHDFFVFEQFGRILCNDFHFGPWQIDSEVNPSIIKIEFIK